jgi:hypothetical protein
MSSSISLASDPLLFRRGGLSFATGLSRYLDSEGKGLTADSQILVRVRPEAGEEPVLAIVDTAAPWCIFTPDVSSTLSQRLEAVPGPIALSTRLGVFRGELYRGTIVLAAEHGEHLDVDATIFLAPEWPGPNFLGYKGFLQRIRFAVDPESNLFYFGRI